MNKVVDIILSQLRYYGEDEFCLEEALAEAQRMAGLPDRAMAVVLLEALEHWGKVAGEGE